MCRLAVSNSCVDRELCVPRIRKFDEDFHRSMSVINRVAASAVRMPIVPPLTPLVTQAMQKLYPLVLADRSWDNVGLLLEPPVPRKRSPDVHTPAVMLTIDLTRDVAKEAIEEQQNVETIVSYRMGPLSPSRWL